MIINFSKNANFERIICGIILRAYFCYLHKVLKVYADEGVRLYPNKIGRVVIALLLLSEIVVLKSKENDY